MQPPVDSINMDFTFLSQRDVEPCLREVTATALIVVLTGPDQGFAADTKFIFLLAKQVDGYYRIREIREVPRQSRGEASAVVGSSWAEIKVLYQ
jgi:hypothetical protein